MARKIKKKKHNVKKTFFQAKHDPNLEEKGDSACCSFANREISFRNNGNDSMKTMAFRAAKKEWRDNKFIKEIKVTMVNGETYTFNADMWAGKNKNGKLKFLS
jgi:hypothetical protein